MPGVSGYVLIVSFKPPVALVKRMKALDRHPHLAG
jgi:hypothetical protein